MPKHAATQPTKLVGLADHLATAQLVTFLQLNGRQVTEETPRAIMEKMYEEIFRSRSAKDVPAR